MTWLEKILNEHRELESPLSFWYWGALAAISAVVKDNVYLDRQIYKLYPNIYVMFHAESGLKKGPPISMAKQLVKAVNNTTIISGRSSIQGILKEMGTATTDEKTGKVKTKSTVFICSSELTSSIVEDKVATDILTDLYDRQYNIGEWRSLLKMESFKLIDPTITMLTATNEAHSTDYFVKKDVHGGYFARTFIVSESKKNRANSLLVPLINPPNYAASAEYLKDIAKLKGPFEPLGARERTDTYCYPYTDNEGETAYFTRAGIHYQRWYDEFSSRDYDDATGTLNRFGDSVLKVAMLIALSKRAELVIDEESMHEAISRSERLVGSVRQMTLAQKGLSQSRELKGEIMKELAIRPNYQATRTMMMNKFWMNYAASNEWDEIMVSLQDAGIIDMNQVGNQIVYTLKNGDNLARFFAGKKDANIKPS